MRAWTVMLIVAALGSSAPVWASGGTEAAGKAPLEGEIAYLEGDVTLDGKDAQIGQAVHRGATVRTGPASVCEITWGGQNIIQVQEKTLAVLDVGSLTPGVRLQTGSVAAVLNKVDAISRNGTFRVKTPSAVAGVRGTVFFVKVEDATSSYICACFGTLAVTPTLGEQVELSATNHVARRFTRVGLSTRVTPAGLLYHDSTSQSNLAKKIGYTVPWGSGEYGTSGSGGY